MATPIQQSNGSTSGLGTADEGRNDLVVGETVGLTDTEALNIGAAYVWTFEDTPIGSSTTMINSTTATPSFVPDVTGSYRILCTVDGTFTSVEVLAIPLPVSGGRMPSFEEELQYDEGGNALGWHYSMTLLLRSMDTAIGAAGVTLDGAYDFSGAGVGRAITADAGAVQITNPNADAANVLELVTTAAGTGAALSITNAGDGAAVTWDNGQLLGPDGVGTAPTYGFSSDLDAGMYLGSVGRVVISAGNNAAMHFMAGKCRVGSSAGSQSSIHISSQGDTNTGVFWGNSDVFGIATNATEAISWNADQQTLTADGTVALPAWSFASSPAMGFYTTALDVMRHAVAGSQIATYTASSVSYDVTLRPSADNATDLGTTAQRWAILYARESYIGTTHVDPLAASSGVDIDITYTAPAHTNLTLSTEVPSVLFDMSATKTWDTGALAAQRFVKFMQPTVDFAAASTAAIASTVYIEGEPLEGANATITAPAALEIGSGQILTPAGLVSAPAYSFAGARTTGLHGNGSTLRLAVNGANRVTLTANSLWLGTAVHATTPKIALSTDTNTGLGWFAADEMGIITGATEAIRWNDSQQTILPGGSAGAPDLTFGATDTGVYGNTVSVSVAAEGTLAATFSNDSTALTQVARSTTALATMLSVTAAAHTVQINGTIPIVDFDLSADVQNAGTTTSFRRAFQIQAPTYSSDTATQTLLRASTLYIDSAPTAGTNVDITDQYALFVDAGGARVDGTLTLHEDSNDIVQFLSVRYLSNPTNQGVENCIGATFDFGSDINYSADGGAIVGGLQLSSPQFTSDTGSSTMGGTRVATLYVDNAPTVSGGNIAFSTDAYAIFVDDGSCRFDGEVWLSDGTVGNPSLALNSDQDTGFYGTTATINVAIAGVQKATLNTNGISVVDTGGATSPGFSFIGDSDTGVTSLAANRVNLIAGGGSYLSVDAGGSDLSQAVQATGSGPTLLSVVGAAHTNLTNSEADDVNFNLARTVQFAGVGSFASQRAFQISAPTYTGLAADITITDAATLYVSGAPVQGTNAVLTNTWAMWVDAGATRLDGDLQVGGDVLPDTDSAHALGVTGTRWLNLWTDAATIGGSVTIGGDLNHDGTNVGFYGTAPAAQSSAYTDAGPTPDRDLSSNNCTTNELTAVLATLINDLQLTGLIG